ncbi:MAG TPA: VOC family protein [Nitriliruptoraceae bacterium]|nr:VOC family protein [Nitriliruptoraceae bacterium]
MATRTHYDAGTPCWIDLSTPDVDAAKEFYSSLFGWSSEDVFDDDGVRIYTNFTRDGKVLAGMAQHQPEMDGMPAMWNTYVATEDVAATAAAVAGAGGQVMLPPMEVMTEGSMAVFADPTGAVVSVWQAADHIGAQIVNEPGAWSWNELMTRDLDAARAFYDAVFGWQTDAMDMGDMGTYHVVRGGKEGIAGMMAMPDDMPAQVPNHWGIYILVDDAQAVVTRVTELGGTVAFGPESSAVGVLATLHDPQGGSFSVMQAPTEDG